jgi:hypothetical protein
VDISADLYARIQGVCNVVVTKDGAGDVFRVSEVRARCPRTMAYLCGTEYQSLPALVLGADGCCNAINSVVPEQVVAIYDAVQAGNLEAARERFQKLQPLYTFIRAHGVDGPRRRPPSCSAFPSGRTALLFKRFPGPPRRSLRKRCARPACPGPSRQAGPKVVQQLDREVLVELKLRAGLRGRRRSSRAISAAYAKGGVDVGRLERRVAPEKFRRGQPLGQVVEDDGQRALIQLQPLAIKVFFITAAMAPRRLSAAVCASTSLGAQASSHTAGTRPGLGRGSHWREIPPGWLMRHCIVSGPTAVLLTAQTSGSVQRPQGMAHRRSY